MQLLYKIWPLTITPEFQSIKAQKEKLKINFKNKKQNTNLCYNKKFAMRDWKRPLKKSYSSYPGPDQIHYENIRHLPIESLYIFFYIINETWKDSTFTEYWRKALIISIPKPGKGNFNHLNYPPIDLTNCGCKGVERMVNQRLVCYLQNNGLLAKQQCGYRANRSTVDHLVRLETYLWCIFSKPAFSCSFLWFAEDIWYNMVVYKIYITWTYEGIDPFFVATFYLIELSKFN